MSLRKLVEGECGGVNPLMQLGGQFTRDVARKDEGLLGHAPFETRSIHPEDVLVKDFLGQISEQPQSFKMNSLLREMREIEQQNFQPQVINAPRVIDEVTRNAPAAWAKEFGQTAVIAPNRQLQPVPQAYSNQINENWEQKNMINVKPVQQDLRYVKEFFDLNDEELKTTMPMNMSTNMSMNMPMHMNASIPAINRFYHQSQYMNDNVYSSYNQPVGYSFSSQAAQSQSSQSTQQKNGPAPQSTTTEDWIDEFQSSKKESEKTASDYNENFWQRLQDEWQKLAENDQNDHPWLSEYSDLLDPYKEYTFTEENPMVELENVFEKGKEFLAKGDIPSAVLCFEAAAKKEPENAEIWELLGTSQAENEMDPQSIAALKKSLELNPNNMQVLMALAVSYTNESIQSHALKMLTTWLHCHPKYKHLVPDNLIHNDENGSAAGSLIRGPQLREIQNLFLEAVKQNPTEVDPDVQGALGVLFNLSSEFDKAVDCFRAALQVRPENAKVWNRLGASLANGSRSVEAVEAYQRALEIEPGFIRVRYNVGVCCMNLKAYKQSAEHLLTALNMQATSLTRSGLSNSVTSSSQQMSESIWSTLKMVIALMGRTDLQEYVNNRNLDALNEAFKD